MPFYCSPFARHESFDELEQRSRSLASCKPKFALLRLPLELRQQVFRYLLPRTVDHTGPNPLASHARNFSAVKKRVAQGMIIPQAKDPSQKGPSNVVWQRGNISNVVGNVVWQRGNISLLSVCRQVHDECAQLLYGSNTFLLFITYSAITFRFNWLLPSGLAPNRHFNFLEHLPGKYMILIKRLVINIDHLDSYTSITKYNVGGSGLTHGLRQQVQRLVNVLRLPSRDDALPSGSLDEANWNLLTEERRLARITVRVSNGNAFLKQVKCEDFRRREGSIKEAEDIQEMLQPFAQLRGVREVAITGTGTDLFARTLEQQMRSLQQPDNQTSLTHNLRDLDLTAQRQLCCYGNDI